MLADPEGDVPPGVRSREDPGARELGLRRLDQIRVAADHRRGERPDRLHDGLARVARSHVLAGREDGQRLPPALARFATAVELPVTSKIRMRSGPGGEPLVPLGLDSGTSLADALHVLTHLVRHGEMRIGIEAHDLLGRANLRLAEWVPVRLSRVDRVRRRVADVRAEDDQRRPGRLVFGGRERSAQSVEVVRVVDVLDVPAVRLEARALVLGREGERGRAVDRDVVVVVEVDERAEPEMACDRRRLRRNTFHQIAVGADRVDPM